MRLHRITDTHAWSVALSLVSLQMDAAVGAFIAALFDCSLARVINTWSEGHNALHCTGVLDEKASASQVLGSYPEHTGALYAPHIQETLNMLLKMGNYFHCQVREQAYISLPLLYTATSQAFPPQPSGPTCPLHCGTLLGLKACIGMQHLIYCCTGSTLLWSVCFHTLCWASGVACSVCV